MRPIKLIVAMIWFAAQAFTLSAAIAAEGAKTSGEPKVIIIPMENAGKNWRIFTVVNQLLSLNWKVDQTEENCKDFPKGSFIISTKNQPVSERRAVKYTEKISQRYNIPINLYNQQTECRKREVIQPKVGVLYSPKWGLMAQHVVEALGFETRLISYEEVWEDVLERFNVLVIGGGKASKKIEGLEVQGIEKIKSFVQEGGGLFGACGGAAFVFTLRMIPVQRGRAGSLAGPVWIKISDSSHPLWYGYKERVRLAPWYGTFFEPETASTKILGTYGKACPGFYISKLNACEVSKYIPGEWDVLEKIFDRPLNPEWLSGKAAILEDSYGSGRVIITYPHPETPGLEEGYSVLGNALFYLAQKSIAGREERKVKDLTSESLQLLEKKMDLALSDIRRIHYWVGDVIRFGIQNGIWYIPENWPRWVYSHASCRSFPWYVYTGYRIASDEILRHAEYLRAMLRTIGEKQKQIPKLAKTNRTKSETKMLDTTQSKIGTLYTTMCAFDQEKDLERLKQLLEPFNHEYKKLILLFKELEIAQKKEADKGIVTSIKRKYEHQKERVTERQAIISDLFDSVVHDISNLKFAAIEADKWIDYAFSCLTPAESRAER